MDITEGWLDHYSNLAPSSLAIIIIIMIIITGQKASETGPKQDPQLQKTLPPTVIISNPFVSLKQRDKIGTEKIIHANHTAFYSESGIFMINIFRYLIIFSTIISLVP